MLTAGGTPQRRPGVESESPPVMDTKDPGSLLRSDIAIELRADPIPLSVREGREAVDREIRSALEDRSIEELFTSRVDRLFQELDRAIVAAIDRGAPVWSSPGSKGWMPQRKLHSFLRHSLNDSAKVDFYRGTIYHDLANWLWAKWYRRCPGYQGRLQRHDLNEKSEGDAMEWLAGVAFAAATDGRYVSHDAGRLDFEMRWDWTDEGTVRIASSKQYWAEVWWCFQALGLGPALERPGPALPLQAVAPPVLLESGGESPSLQRRAASAPPLPEWPPASPAPAAMDPWSAELPGSDDPLRQVSQPYSGSSEARNIARLLNSYKPDAVVLGAGLLQSVSNRPDPGASGDAPPAAEGPGLSDAGRASDSAAAAPEEVPVCSLEESPSQLPPLSNGFVPVPIEEAGEEADDGSESGSSAKRRRQGGTGETDGSHGEAPEGGASGASGDAPPAADDLPGAPPPDESPVGSPATSFAQLLANFKNECPGYCPGIYCGKCGHACSKKKDHKGRCACASHDLSRAVNEVRASFNPNAPHASNQALLDCLHALKFEGRPGYVAAPVSPTPDEHRGVIEKFNECMRDATLTVGSAWTQMDARRSLKGEPPLPPDWCALDETAAAAVQAVRDGADPAERPEAYAGLAHRCRAALEAVNREGDAGVSLVRVLTSTADRITAAGKEASDERLARPWNQVLQVRDLATTLAVLVAEEWKGDVDEKLTFKRTEDDPDGIHCFSFQWPEDLFPEAERSGRRLAASLTSVLNFPSSRVTPRDWTARGGFLDFEDLESARWVAASVHPVTIQFCRGEADSNAATPLPAWGVPVHRRVIKRDHVDENCTFEVLREGLGDDVAARTLDSSLPSSFRDEQEEAGSWEDEGGFEELMMVVGNSLELPCPRSERDTIFQGLVSSFRALELTSLAELQQWLGANCAHAVLSRLFMYLPKGPEVLDEDDDDGTAGSSAAYVMSRLGNWWPSSWYNVVTLIATTLIRVVEVLPGVVSRRYFREGDGPGSRRIHSTPEDEAPPDGSTRRALSARIRQAFPGILWDRPCSICGGSLGSSVCMRLIPTPVVACRTCLVINVHDERKVPPEYFKGVFKGMKSADPEAVDRGLATEVLVAEARAGCRIVHPTISAEAEGEVEVAGALAAVLSARVRLREELVADQELREMAGRMEVARTLANAAQATSATPNVAPESAPPDLPDLPEEPGSDVSTEFGSGASTLGEPEDEPVSREPVGASGDAPQAADESASL